MDTEKDAVPTIIIPYPGVSRVRGEQDIFVFLRPETNGVMAESAIFKVVKKANGSNKYLNLVFLANYPGEFIVAKQIVEQFYSLRLHFAVVGKNAFTENMQARFARWSGTPFDEADIIGAFQARELLGLKPEELFATWVSASDMCVLNGQVIKKIQNRYVVNYDIPALIHKNSKNTDIAVMVFRTGVSYDHFKQLVQEMQEALGVEGLLPAKVDAARAFHYSKGPFEQIRDGIVYLTSDSRMKLKLEDFTFARYLIGRGVDGKDLLSLLLNPIVEVRHGNGTVTEENFFIYTQFDDFETGMRKYESIVSRRELIHHSSLILDIALQ